MKLLINISCIISLALLVVLPGCKENDLPGYSQAINPIWEYSFNVGGLTGSMAPLLYDNKVMFSPDIEITPEYDANEELIALDKNSGKLIWKWSDFFNDKYVAFSAKKPKYLYEGILAFTVGASDYAIDLSDGKTIWRNWRTPSFADLIGKENRIYRTDGYEPFDIGIYCNQLIEANIHTGDWKVVFEIKGGDSLQNLITVPAFHTNSRGDEILIMGNTAWNSNITGDEKNFVTPHMIAYNRTQDHVEYNVQLDEPGLINPVDWYPKILGNKVYLTVGNGIVCHDLETGEKIWKQQFYDNFASSGMLVVNGRIYANRDGSDPTLYCIDPDSGNILWQQPSAGTASPIQYHKGVLYFVSGHSGALHIVNATTGETIHKILAPSEFENSNDFFNATGCVIDTEEDRIYLSSFTKAYCYPTVEL